MAPISKLKENREDIYGQSSSAIDVVDNGAERVFQAPSFFLEVHRLGAKKLTEAVLEYLSFTGLTRLDHQAYLHNMKSWMRVVEGRLKIKCLSFDVHSKNIVSPLRVDLVEPCTFY